MWFPSLVDTGMRFLLPAGPFGMSNSVVDVPVRLGHLLEAGVVDNQIGTKDVEQREKVVAAQLHGRRGDQNHGLSIVAKVADP